MSNEVARTGHSAPGLFGQYAAEVSNQTNITGLLLRYTKHGSWKFGPDLEEMPVGTRMIMSMQSMKVGWVKWVDSMPAQHVIGNVTEGFKSPNREDLGDTDKALWEENGTKDPWQRVNYVQLCDAEGTIYTFATSSKGGLDAIGKICEAYDKNQRMEPNKIPVIELQSTSYEHPSYGETFKPVLKLIGFQDIPDNFADLTEALETSDSNNEPVELISPPPRPQASRPKPTLVQPAKPAPAPAKKVAPPAKPVAKSGKRPVKF